MMEQLVAILVGRGYEYHEVGKRLEIAPATAKWHAQKASRKLPGRDAPRMKLQLWWRGATADVLNPPSEG